jgi:hypothetical protein
MSYFSPVHMQALDYMGVLYTVCRCGHKGKNLFGHFHALSPVACTATLLLLPMAHRLPLDDASFPFVSHHHPASFPPGSFFNTTVYTTIIRNHRRNHSHRRPGTCRALRGAYNFPFFLFSWLWQNPNLSCTYALLYIRFSVYNLAVGGNNNSLVILKELL